MNYIETDRIKDAAQVLKPHVHRNEAIAQLYYFLRCFAKAPEDGRSAVLPLYRSGASLLLLATRHHSTRITNMWWELCSESLLKDTTCLRVDLQDIRDFDEKLYDLFKQQPDKLMPLVRF